MIPVRLLVALGVQVVAGSNPVAPTIRGARLSEVKATGAGPFDYPDVAISLEIWSTALRGMRAGERGGGLRSSRFRPWTAGSRTRLPAGRRRARARPRSWRGTRA